MWQPIETAPKDGTIILVWHDHDSDPYNLGGGYLTTYGAHCEGFCVEYRKGPYFASFGGELNCHDGYIPPWWFKDGDDWEHPLAPTHWIPLPEPPTDPAMLEEK